MTFVQLIQGGALFAMRRCRINLYPVGIEARTKVQSGAGKPAISMMNALGASANPYQLRQLRLHGLIDRTPISRHRPQMARRALLYSNLQSPSVTRPRHRAAS